MLHLIVLLCLCIPKLSYGYTDLVDDKMNYDEATKNRDELKRHVDCYLDKEPCSDDERRYKNHVLDAVANRCKYCSPKEKHYGHVFLDRMEKEFPDDYREFVKKYDPEGTHIKDVRKDFNQF